MTEIIQIENDVLRKTAETVAVDAISGDEIQHVLWTMEEALEKAPHGAALAAPQIGVSKRIFIVSPHIFREAEPPEELTEELSDDQLVFINPEIVRSSRGTEIFEEGCLSIKGVYGRIPRAEKVTVRAYDRHAHRFERGASGLLAQIFQHEIDHLDGVLFVDGAVETWEVDEQYHKTD